MGHAKETWDKVEEFVSGYGEIVLPSLVTKEIKADFKHLPYSLSRYKFARQNAGREKKCYRGWV